MTVPIASTLVLVQAMLWSPLALPQDPQPPAKQDPAPPPARSEDAKKQLFAILDAAIATQNGQGYADHLEDFEATLSVHTRDDKKGDLEFKVERSWKAPNLIWTHVTEKVTGKDYEQGYDGGDQYWYRDKEGPKLLEGPNYKEDRKTIRLDLELMNLMMQFCFLKNAQKDLSNAELLPSVKVMRPDPKDISTDVETECDVLRAKMELAKAIGGSSMVTMHIERNTHYLAQVRIEPIDSSTAATELHFSAHVKNAQGVIVPQNIDVYRGTETTPWQRLMLDGLDRADPDGNPINNIRFNTGMDASRFQPPKPKK